MQHLRKPPQNNFATFAAVFAGINNAAVCRLRFTRRELPKEEKKVSPPSSQARGVVKHLTSDPRVPYANAHTRTDAGGAGAADEP